MAADFWKPLKNRKGEKAKAAALRNSVTKE
jgi:hypothetical protein